MTGDEYGIFPFVWKTKIFKWKINYDDDIILFATKNGKILNKRYLWKYWSSVLETWHHKCASQKNHNDTLNVIAITWVSGLSKGRGQEREDGKKGLTQTSLLDHVVHPDSGRCPDWIIYNAPWRHNTGIKNFIMAYSVNWQAGELI